MLAVAAARVHVPPMVSLESDITVTLAPTPGLDRVPASVSETVTVAVVLCDTSIGFVENATVVVVVRLLTVSVWVALVNVGLPTMVAVTTGVPAVPSL